MMDPLLLNTGDGACRTTKNTNLKQQEEGAMLALGGAGSPTVCKLCKINEGCVHTSLTDVKNNQEKGNYKIGYCEKAMLEAAVSNHSLILTHNSTCMVIKYAGFRGCNCLMKVDKCFSFNFFKEKKMLGLPPTPSVPKDKEEHANHQASSLVPETTIINPPIITHTAATPAATPQGSPNEMTSGIKDTKNTLTVAHAFNMSSLSIDSVDKSAVRMVLQVILNLRNTKWFF